MTDRRLDGTEDSLSAYRGRVVLIVDQLETRMSSARIAEAQRLAREWLRAR